jgi:hypothetical protein
MRRFLNFAIIVLVSFITIPIIYRIFDDFWHKNDTFYVKKSEKVNFSQIELLNDFPSENFKFFLARDEKYFVPEGPGYFYVFKDERNNQFYELYILKNHELKNDTVFIKEGDFSNYPLIKIIYQIKHLENNSTYF